MPRRGEYLYQRKGSSNWWLRLQIPIELQKHLGAKKIEKSLGTPDRTVAEIKAASDIALHKLRLYALKAKKAGVMSELVQREHEPGEHTLSDGTRIFATEDTIHVLSPDGKIIETKPNVSEKMIAIRLNKADGADVKRMLVKHLGPPQNAVNKDDGIIETWAEHRGKEDYITKEARAVWDLFKQITKNKPLAKCTRDDGRALARALHQSGNKSATVAKKISHLRAAVNLAMDEGKLTFNPFSNVVPKRDDAEDRLPLTEEDMMLVRENLHRLSDEDRLLWIWLATTGMRLSEAFEATEEFREDGVRFIRIGTKSNASYRPVPIPDAVLRLLPSKIKGPIFTDTAKNAGKRLNRFLDKLGIDERKAVHSLRHRAKSRLESLGCPEGVQYKILGHSDKNVGSRYLHVGVAQRKAWLDKLGY